MPRVIFSDRATICEHVSDELQMASILHELISGIKINYLPNGEKMLHPKVKNGQYYKHVKKMLDLYKAKQENSNLDKF